MKCARPGRPSRAAPHSLSSEVIPMPRSAEPSQAVPRMCPLRDSMPALVLAALAVSAPLVARPAAAAAPRVHAIRNARIVTGPGNVIARGTIVMRDGLITAVGASVAIPADARVWEGDSLTVYPGLIDAFVMPAAPAGPGGGAPFGGARPGGQQAQAETPRGPVHELSAVRAEYRMVQN